MIPFRIRALTPARLPTLVLGALPLACGRTAPSPQLPEAGPTLAAAPEPPPEEPGRPKTGQVPRITVFAGQPPGMTVTQAPPKPEAPEPTAAYPSLRLACDAIETLAKDRHFAVTRADGVPVDFGFGGPPRAGCEFKAGGKLTRAAPDPAVAATPTADEPSTLAIGFEEAGWAQMVHCQADGPDGEAEGWRSKETTCVVRWSWDGGDDSGATAGPRWAGDRG
jgi:hypothetical protein